MSDNRTENGRESNSKESFNSSHSSTKPGSVMKRLLVLLFMTVSLVFAGAQSVPTSKASTGCEMVCGEPYTDPNSGECVQMCCPEDPMCMRPCVIVPCKGAK